MGEPVGVLLMAYGSPAGPEDVEAYYTHVRRGRPPAPEQLADLRRRYDAIGGTSPLRQVTDAQAAALRVALDDADPGRFVVEVGMKHAAPFVEDAVAALAAAGVRRAVGLVLAPHYSELSVGEYVRRAREAPASSAGGGMALTFVEHWHDAPGYLDVLADAVTRAVGSVASAPEDTEVLFTAHSLPARILDTGDPYPAQLAETAEAVAARTGAPHWSVAWQSAGRTPEPWLGPDVLEVLPRLRKAGRRGVVVCPAGFVADHLEVRYDLDVEARQAAEAAGLHFARTATPNATAAFVATLADVVLTHIAA